MASRPSASPLPERASPVRPSRLRRLMLAGLGSALGLPASGRAAAPAALSFPRDFGSHPELRTEWWYITGYSTSGPGEQGHDLGFQLTFFRVRLESTQTMASRFAARHLLFAHAALTDLRSRRFWHDQRMAREGFAIAQAGQADTDLRLHDWTLKRLDGAYLAQVASRDFGLQLAFRPTQPLLLQGAGGVSRKGPGPTQSSWYYSQPQMAFDGAIRIADQRLAVRGGASAPHAGAASPGAPAVASNSSGAAWLDHEWSGQFLHPDAVGWDWIGINLFDGSALTAFQIRDRAGRALWDGGSFRHPKLDAGSRPYVFARGEVIFQPQRFWKSPLTQAIYPVQWLVRTPSDHYLLKALLDNQELDSRRSSGAVYWEGLSELFDSAGKSAGRGYLEMTGYAQPLVM